MVNEVQPGVCTNLEDTKEDNNRPEGVQGSVPWNIDNRLQGVSARVVIGDPLWDDNTNIEEKLCVVNCASSGAAGVQRFSRQERQAELNSCWQTAQRMIRCYLVHSNCIAREYWEEVRFSMDLTKREISWYLPGREAEIEAWEDILEKVQSVRAGSGIEMTHVFDALVDLTKAARGPGSSPIETPAGFYTTPQSVSLIEGSKRNMPSRIQGCLQRLASELSSIDRLLHKLRGAGIAYEEQAVRHALGRVDQTIQALLQSIDEEVQDLQQQLNTLRTIEGVEIVREDIRQQIARLQERKGIVSSQKAALYLVQYMRTSCPFVLDISRDALKRSEQYRQYSAKMQREVTQVLHKLGMPKSSGVLFFFCTSYSKHIQKISAYFTALTLTGPSFEANRSAATRSRIIDFLRAQQIYEGVPGSTEYQLLRWIDVDVAAQMPRDLIRNLPMVLPEFASREMGPSLQRVQELRTNLEATICRDQISVESLEALYVGLGGEAHSELYDSSSGKKYIMPILDQVQRLAEGALARIGQSMQRGRAQAAYQQIMKIREVILQCYDLQPSSVDRSLPRRALKVAYDQWEILQDIQRYLESVVYGRGALESPLSLRETQPFMVSRRANPVERLGEGSASD